VRILVIEDNAALRMILQRFLSDEGYAVEIVPDVAVGPEIFAKKCRPCVSQQAKL
jgi:DNA-binding response OmpR family regulator